MAVPEGLPLTVAISLAYSVMRMKDDQILVKNLQAPEIMGGVDEIVTGKTGTLTKDEQKVISFYCQAQLIKNQKRNTFTNCAIYPKIVELVKESILFNCDARVEMNEDAMFESVGNGTECGLLDFLQ